MAPHPAPRPARPSPRERPAKPALTRAGIIATAVALTRAEGLKRVTMRRLAQELDTGPASLYVYVRNTAELHAAVLDELLGAVDLSPAGTGAGARADDGTDAGAGADAEADAEAGAADEADAAGDWRERLVRVLTSYTSVLFEYPGLAQSALVARPSGEHYLGLAEALLSLLSEGGVPPDQAAWALDLLLQFATATAAEHAAPGRPAPGTDAAPAREDEAEWDALGAALQGVSRRTHPHIAALGGELLSGPGRARLVWGFHVLINGALHTPRPTQGPTPAPGAPPEPVPGPGA